ncbi:MAG: hypothetical protein V3V92_01675 [Candidatus Hydrothermarchaeales archaeon]
MLKVEFEALGSKLEILEGEKEHLLSEFLPFEFGELGSLDNQSLTRLQISSRKRLEELQDELDVLILRIGREVDRWKATRARGDVKRLKSKTSLRARNSSGKGLTELQNEMDELILRMGQNIVRNKATRVLSK